MNFTFDHNNINVRDLEKSLTFYQAALGLVEVRRYSPPDGRFTLVYLGDGKTSHLLELTWLRDHQEPYSLGDNEFHLALRVDDFPAALKKHQTMKCVCLENTAMGIYFIEDPDGYWIEVLPFDSEMTELESHVMIARPEEKEDLIGASDEPVEIPINGVLDLHTFRPEEVKTLVPDYIQACREKGIFSLRIIHGKGKGILQRSVHAILSRLPEVLSYRLADSDAGSWGATLVEMKKIMTETTMPKYPLPELETRLFAVFLEVQKNLGSDVPERAYQDCLAFELERRQISFQHNASLQSEIEGQMMDSGFRVDFLIDGQVLLDIKCRERPNFLDAEQMKTYLRLSGMTCGFIANFRSPRPDVAWQRVTRGR